MIFKYEKITQQISRPIIPVYLRSKKTFVFYQALIDSGADFCMFSIEIAKALDVKLTKSNNTLKGIGKDSINGYWGEVEIKVGTKRYTTTALFADIEAIGHGILGQRGFFDHFDVRLNYQEQRITVTPYTPIQ